LGLSLVGAVVAMHKGRIELKDNNPGLRVEICFPALNTAMNHSPEIKALPAAGKV